MGATTSSVAGLPVVRSLRVRTLVVPLAEPLRTASGVMPAAPMLLIDIATSAGHTGRAYLFTYTPVVLQAAARLAVDLAPLLAEQPAAPLPLMERLRAGFRLLGSAGLLDMVLSAIDTALWDAWALALEQPLVQVLGGQAGEGGTPVRAYASYGMEDRETTVRNVATAAQEGFSAVKIKIGHPTLAQDLDIVHAALRALEGRAQLLVDYNQSLSVPEAVVRCRALDALGLLWIEEPTRFDDTRGHACIARAIDTPLQLGENLWGPTQIADSLAAGASDCMMPDLARVGGVTGWQQAAGLCAAQRVPVSNHFYQEASIHLLQATPTAQLLEYFRMADPVLAEPLRIENGHAVAPTRPGHGMVWDEAQVARFET